MTWTDLKLGGRMLAKYPGLTAVGGLAMAFAICVGIIIFQFAGLFVYPSLPLANGDRIVKVELQDVSANEPEEKALFDFVSWRGSLQSIDNLGASRTSTRNLIVAEGDARPAYAAEMSASGFAVAGGQPLMGRVFAAADEQAAAPAVAVIGHDLWRTRFGSDPNVVGRRVQLGAEEATIVGVMREGFAFPVSHELWLPLKTDILDQAPRSGPAIAIFGMLAEGHTLETAQAELTTLGRRSAADQPVTHQFLEPRVSAYAAENGGSDLTFMLLVYLFVAMLVVLMCGNVGLLLFARAATRESDLIVRTALGASRWRLVSQLFAEALVLGGLAAVVGLAAADLTLRNWALPFLEANYGRLPFWWDLSISPATVAAAISLMVVAATVAGVMPALKITRGMGDRLKQTTAGSGGLRFGGVWTVVIVAQVAVTVVFPAIVAFEQFMVARMQDFNAGFATDQFLAVQIEQDSPAFASAAGTSPAATSAEAEAEAAARTARLAVSLEELRRRIAAQPGVTGVTYAADLPGTGYPEGRIEMGYDSTDDATNDATATGAGTAAALPPLRVATIAGVDPSYFDVIGASFVAGRGFTAADAGPGARVAVVDQRFVDEVLQGRNPIGQQVRFANPDNPDGPSDWIEVVGFVRNLDISSPYRDNLAAGLYLPGRPELFNDANMLVRVRGGDPMSAAPPIQQIAAAVDPELRLIGIQRASDINESQVWVLRMWVRITIVTSAMALLLSLAGLYSVMAFAVAKRTREIGVRVALGGSRQRILMAIFRRPVTQMGLGILAGVAVVLAATILYPNSDGPGADQAAGLTLEAAALLVAYGTFMLMVCLLACVVPTRRALAVEPTIALRTE